MRFLLTLLVLFVSACSSTQNSTPSSTAAAQTAPENTAQPAQQTVPESSRVYYLQHKLLPEWTHTTGGRFYDALVINDLEKLKFAASEIISSEYAEAIQSEYFPDHQAVLIQFPHPKVFANCYFVLIRKNDRGYDYYTYEKTMNFGDDDPVVGVVGAWSEEGQHLNLGARDYQSGEDFFTDVIGNLTTN